MKIKLNAAKRLTAYSNENPLVPTRVLLSEDEVMEAEDAGKFVPPLHGTDYWKGMGAGALILAIDTKKILMGKRSDEVNDSGMWSTFGGSINHNETPKKAMLREIEEETGLPGGTPYNKGHTNGAHGVFPLMTYRDLARGFVYYNFLVVVDKQFEPKLNWESDGADWFEFGDWPEPLHPGAALLLEDKVSMDTVRYHIERGEDTSGLKPRIQTKDRQ